MGFIALPFFALLFAIIETGIVFFAGQVIETAIQDCGRLLFTHQAQDCQHDRGAIQGRRMQLVCRC